MRSRAMRRSRTLRCRREPEGGSPAHEAVRGSPPAVPSARQRPSVCPPRPAAPATDPAPPRPRAERRCQREQKASGRAPDHPAVWESPGDAPSPAARRALRHIMLGRYGYVLRWPETPYRRVCADVGKEGRDGRGAIMCLWVPIGTVTVGSSAISSMKATPTWRRSARASASCGPCSWAADGLDPADAAVRHPVLGPCGVLIERWCERRALFPLAQVLPSYIQGPQRLSGWNSLLAGLERLDRVAAGSQLRLVRVRRGGCR